MCIYLKHQAADVESETGNIIIAASQKVDDYDWPVRLLSSNER